MDLDIFPSIGVYGGDISMNCRPVFDSTCAVVATADDFWEDLVVKNDVGYLNTKRALDITKQFIADNNLILIGGMAIDMSLKAAGREGIYLSEKLPDYDFISPDTAAHAASLSHILCKEHLINVSAINAMHTTTIKVRSNFTPAADIGFCPKVIFDHLPTIRIGNIRVIHPHFQIIDIHRSLSYPFDRAQVIDAGLFYRWKKDCARYDLLLDVYPVQCPGDCDTIATVRIKLDVNLLAGDCLAGWIAIDHWKSATGLLSDQISEYTIPAGEAIQVFTDNFDKYVRYADPGSDSIQYYEAVLGHLPRHIKVTISGQKYEVFDNLGALLSAERISHNNGAGGDIWIANLQHCMLFLLDNIYILTRGSSKPLVAYCQMQYVECVKLLAAGDIPGIIPSINVFGSTNWDESYLIGRRKFVARLSGVKLQTHDVIDGVYPVAPKCAAMIPFKYDMSPYFAISGARCGAFIKREVSSIGSS